MKIFLTGATGFVGSRLVSCLLESGHELSCLIRRPEGQVSPEVLTNCHIIKGDVTDRESLRNTMINSDLVIHLAVATPLTTDPKNWRTFHQTNVLGTRYVLEECLISKVNKILCFSSTASIGRPRVGMIDENTPAKPVTPYGLSKKMADEIILEFIKIHHLPAITLLFPHIYGPGNTHDFLKIVKMIKQGTLPQFGFSPNLLPMLYWSDAIEAILTAIERGHPGEKYIIADDDPHDIRKIRQLVRKHLGQKRQIYPFIPKYLGILGAYFLEKIYGLVNKNPPIKAENIQSITAGRRLSIKKAKQDLNFLPKVDLEEGIKRTLDWYKEENLI